MKCSCDDWTAYMVRLKELLNVSGIMLDVKYPLGEQFTGMRFCPWCGARLSDEPA